MLEDRNTALSLYIYVPGAIVWYSILNLERCVTWGTGVRTGINNIYIYRFFLTSLQSLKWLDLLKLNKQKTKKKKLFA